ncbi:hypothetical protein GF337_03125 [candidate division KSB1 bacterium]|nr:hypothetical protein [candidate division KSB1 bacterium]
MKNKVGNLSNFYIFLFSVSVLILVSFTTLSQAQIPASISYQGCLKNNNGDPQTGTFNLLFKLYESESGGSAIWSENHIGVQVENGYFDVILTGLAQLPFTKQYWLGIYINGGQELTPRSRFTSVPYSLNTKSIPDQVVTSGKIKNGAVTLEKINTAGAGADQTPVFNGSNLIWKNISGGSGLPFLESYSGGGDVFRITNTGNANQILELLQENTIHNSSVLVVKNKGLGEACEFAIENSSNESDAMWLKTKGKGKACFIKIDNPNNAESALDVETNGTGIGIYVTHSGSNGDASRFFITNSSNNDDALYAKTSGAGRAGYFAGDVHVSGTLTCSNKQFLIDHPLDPANKILRHSCIESPEMINIYKGRATLENGRIEIQLPDYFDALNHPEGREINLTPINGWSPLFLEGEINNNHFIVKTTKEGNPEQEFSWIIYGVRNDEYARNNPIIVEEEKGVNNRYKRGEYLNSNSGFKD